MTNEKRMITLTIDGHKIDAIEGTSVLEVALANDIYIPTICYHPDLPPFSSLKLADKVYRSSMKFVREVSSGGETQTKHEVSGCGLCVVKIDGMPGLPLACVTPATEGMLVHVTTPEVEATRKANLANILAAHPHACLTCAERVGCSREPCSLNVPVNERCCPQLGRCELQRVAEYIGIPEYTPRYVYANLPTIKEEPLFVRDYNLCIGCTRCVRICNEIRGVNALAVVNANGKQICGTIAPTLKDSNCNFCGACVEVCPTKAINDKLTISVWANRQIELVPCKTACPVDIDVPRYINLIRTKRFKEASALIRESVPFARTLSYICPHPCETKCRRNELNEPISICALKRFVIEKHSCNFLGGSAISPPEKTVAIVGAGPTGLTAAYYLRKLGYAVTLYDAAQSPGGMMRVGIPAYRLPREVLQSDIDEILNMGIDLKLRTKLGEELTLEALQAQYDAVLLAIGAQRSIRLKLEGTELNNVFWGLEFLRATNTGTPPNINGYRVVVIGGGNVAIDVALTALRLGAKDVQLACLERYDEMPAFKWEIDQALEEGVKLNFCWGPHRIIGDTADNVRAIELVRCTTVFDNEGKFNPRFDFTVRTTMDTDAVILAVGQIPDFSFIDRDTGLEVVDGRMLKVNQETLETTVRKIYAGGDVVKGPSSVVEAIAMGRKSALSIDKQLGGTGELPSGTELRTEPAKPHWPGSSEPEFYAKPRVRMPKLPVESRKNNFSAVELGFDESMALEEASRCLSCDLRFELREVPSPPVPSEKWIDFTIEQLQTVPETAGVYQLLDSNKAIVYIKGTPNLREALVEEYKLRTEKAVRYFEFEEEPLYTKRESELLQDHLQKYGKMPLFNEELEDLF